MRYLSTEDLAVGTHSISYSSRQRIDTTAAIMDTNQIGSPLLG